MFKVHSGFYKMYNAAPCLARNLMASAYSYWSNRRKYGGVHRYWRDLLAQSQWWSEERMKEFQLARLKEILTVAHEHCPFYRSALKHAGISPEDIRSLDGVRDLPIINKQIVRDHYDDVKTPFARNKHLVFSTSGTSGSSLRVPVTVEALQREYAFRWQHQAVAGARMGDRFAVFTGHSVVPMGRTRPPFHVSNYTENSIMFSLYHMSDEVMGSYVEALNAFRPQYVYGYPSGIFVLTDFIHRTGRNVTSPKAVFTASEKLHSYQRRLIEEVLQAPIYEYYGQVEWTVMLQECTHHRLHVKEEYGYLELLKEDGTHAKPGETGMVVGTGWGNKAFPLIRYDTGDKMVLSKEQSCPCGRAGRIVQEVLGRDDDLIRTPDGRYVGSLEFIFGDTESVKESQIVQESLDSIVVRVVPFPNYNSEVEDFIKHQLQSRVGTGITIRVETVPAIPRTKSGKMRYVISNVPGIQAGRKTDASRT